MKKSDKPAVRKPVSKEAGQAIFRRAGAEADRRWTAVQVWRVNY